MTRQDEYKKLFKSIETARSELRDCCYWRVLYYRLSKITKLERERDITFDGYDKDD